jgi:hypothetical protein
MSFRSSFSLLSSRAQANVIGRAMGRQERVMLAGTMASVAILFAAQAQLRRR